MPYLLNFPTLDVDEFIQRAVKKYNAKLKTTTIMGPKGSESVRYLERTVDGKIFQAALQEQGMVYLNDVRSLCTKLKMPTKEFDDHFPMERYFDDLGRMIDPDEEKKN